MKRFFRTILLILNAIALLLMLGSTMAGVVPPSKFIGFSLLSYGYLYFLLLNVVFIIIWLMLSSKWFLLSLAGILLRMSFIPLFFQVGGTDKVDDDDGQPMLKVMSFNAHGFRGSEMGDFTVKDSNMLEFIQILEEEQPDVLVLQEYVNRGDTVILSDRLGRMGYRHKISAEGRPFSGEIIFSKLPTVYADGWCDVDKFYADMLWNDDTVRIYCLHLDSYHLDQSDHKQIHDISHGNVDSTMGRSTFRKFRETILTHEQEWETIQPFFESRDRMTVVAGDFNDMPASYLYQQFRKLFVDSYCEAGLGFSTTYHGDFRTLAAFTAFRIDMVLHTPDLQAIAYKRIKSDISDHYPILVTLVKHGSALRPAERN